MNYGTGLSVQGKHITTSHYRKATIHGEEDRVKTYAGCLTIKRQLSEAPLHVASATRKDTTDFAVPKNRATDLTSSPEDINALLLHRGNETGIQMRTQTKGRANSRILREKSAGVQEVQKHKEKRTPLQNN
jgi:hypothetical protein